MIICELHSQIVSIRNALWSGGIYNPLEAMEQIAYQLFLRRLDKMHTQEENKSQLLGKPIERRILAESKDLKDLDYNNLRGSRFKHFGAPLRFGLDRPVESLAVVVFGFPHLIL